MARFLLVCLLTTLGALALAAHPADSQQNAITGTVLDPGRAPIPRATVRLLDAAGAELSRTLADPLGRFRFGGLAPGHNRVEGSLVGFETASADASTGSAVELTLPLAPVRESIVVSATRTEAPTSQIGASTTLLDESEIAGRQAVTVSDLLQATPGVFALRSGGLGTVTTVFMRGGESNYNKVILDGIPLNEPGGFFNFSNLMTEDIERIEVVRGPQSALFGSDAMSGVIQLFTRRGQPETKWPHFAGSAEGGKYHTWRARAGVSGQARKLDYSLAGSRFSTDNQEPNNYFHNTTLSTNTGYAFDDRTSLRLILRGELERVGTPGQTVFQRPDLDAFFGRRDAYGGLSLRNQTASWWEQRFTYTLAKSRQVSRNLVVDPPYVPSFEGSRAPFTFSDFLFDTLSEYRRHHAAWQSDWRAGSIDRAAGQHAIDFAFEWDRELGSFGNRLSGPPAHARRDNFGFTIQHQAMWRRAFLTSGVRVEQNESFGNSVVPRSSLAYLLRAGGAGLGAAKLKFNFGLGIKEPTFLQSFSPAPSFQGNPNLAAERARSFDFGVEQRLASDRAKVELNWFDNRFRNLIAFQSLGGGRGTYFNIGRTKAKGAETALEIAPGGGLRLLGAYTFLDSQVTESTNPFSPVFEAGRPLFRRPRHTGSLRAFWNRGNFNVTATAGFIGRRSDSDLDSLAPPLLSNPGYSKWDLAWSYRAPHHVTWFGVFENVLNQDYMEALGYRALKFTYRGGLRLDF